MPDDAPRLGSPVPVTILTGFLGAGKTTLLNHLVHRMTGQRVAVLVNDFGDINVDANLVESEGQAGDVFNLGGGCICCSIQGHLTSAVMALLGREEPPEHILVEASGVSDPFAIAMTFMAPGLRSSLRLDAILAVVDAEAAPYPMAPRRQDLVEAQVRAANIVILNKIDRASPRQIFEVRDWVKALTPQARLLEAEQACVPLPLVMDTGTDWLADFGDDRRGSDQDEHHHDHGDTFQTWSYASHVPFATLGDVKQALKDLPEGVFRGKGVLAAEETNRRVVMQMAGRRVAFTFQQPWRDEVARRTQLVFIGRPGALAGETLEATLNARLAGAAAFT